MNKLFYLSLLFVFVSCRSNLKNERNNKLIYDVLNASIQVDTLSPAFVCIKLHEPFYAPKLIRKELFDDDTIFLNKQLADWEVKSIDSNKLFFIDTANNSYASAVIDNTCDSCIGYSLSYPLLSKDSSRALMSIGKYCGGKTLGGMVVILKRTDSKWIKEKELYKWNM